MNDPYRTLGIPRKAPQDAVKQAYRRLAMELHPDRNPENPRIADKFKEVSAAYAIIGDTGKRARFDRGEIDAWGRRRPRSPTPPTADKAGAARPTRSQPESPDADKPERASGGSRDKTEKSTSSSGPTGPQPQSAPEQPPQPAKKTGTQTRWLGGGIKAEDLFGPLFPTKAQRAKRSATVTADPTHRLRVGFVEAARGASKRLTTARGRTLDVAVPAGIRDGQVIRLKGQGETGPLGGRGDALVKIEVTPHKLFRAEGDDVHLEVPVSLEEAVLGARIRVPTVDGSVEVSIPRGANSGAQLRLRGKGLRRTGAKSSGDQVLRLVIKLPHASDPDLEAFVRRRQGQTAFDPRENMGAI